jgi:hypothetical protein
MKNEIIILSALLICYSCSTTTKITKQTNPVTVNQVENKTIISGIHDGTSFESAIIMKEKNENEGVKAEYVWLRANYPGYKLKQQGLNFHKEKAYDILYIISTEGKEKTIYFDISNFYGKL